MPENITEFVFTDLLFSIMTECRYGKFAVWTKYVNQTVIQTEQKSAIVLPKKTFTSECYFELSDLIELRDKINKILEELKLER